MEPTYKRCPVCMNDYEVEALCFHDDPIHEICNGCWRSNEGIGYPDRTGSPDLKINVSESVKPKDLPHS